MRIQYNTIGRIGHLNEQSIGVVTNMGERLIIERSKFNGTPSLGMSIVVHQTNTEVNTVEHVTAWYHELTNVDDRDCVTIKLAA